MKDKAEEVLGIMRGTQMGEVEVGDLTRIAQEMASYSLVTYRGKLLDRALDISKSLVEFELEMKYPD